MSESIHHAPGTFCWNELGTSDAAGAKRFYSELIGWRMNDVPMGDQGTYTLVKVEGKDVAGLYEMKGEMFKGVPPHWLSYVSVEDVHASAKKAASLGGTILSEPMSVPGVGEIAVVRDPTGGVFALFKGREHPGAAKLGMKSGTFCWNELMTTDAKAATTFYTALFGWRADEQDMGGMKYTMLKSGDTSAGGLMQMPSEMRGVPTHWMSYVTVDDCDAAVKRSQRLGGKTVVPPTDIPNVGRFATIQDPQGAHVSVIKLNAG
jgi:predicted enzyme related to lactoylglutathione lyase